MNDITAELFSVLHGRRSNLPVAAGPATTPTLSTKLSEVSETVTSSVEHSAERLRSDFSDLAAIPTAVRTRVAQAAAAVRAARDEVERLLSAVELDLATQLTAAQGLYAGLEGVGSAAVGVNSADPAGLGALRAVTGGASPTSLLSDSAAKQVAEQLAKLNVPAPATEQAAPVPDAGATKS